MDAGLWVILLDQSGAFSISLLMVQSSDYSFLHATQCADNLQALHQILLLHRWLPINSAAKFLLNNFSVSSVWSLHILVKAKCTKPNCNMLSTGIHLTLFMTFDFFCFFKNKLIFEVSHRKNTHKITFLKISVQPPKCLLFQRRHKKNFLYLTQSQKVWKSKSYQCFFWWCHVLFKWKKINKTLQKPSVIFNAKHIQWV